MNVVYSPNHTVHDPPHEYSSEGQTEYPECPARVKRILQGLKEAGLETLSLPRQYKKETLRRVHTAAYLDFLEQIFPAWTAAGYDPVLAAPVVFALGSGARCPAQRVHQMGFYGYDTTPLVPGTFKVAWSAAQCALTGADLLLEGASAAYALCRPPGHHAGSGRYGGYCYLNNAALAAAHLAAHGRVAVIDLDYHHGNGTQEIFYESNQVLCVSLHADPDRAYPFYWGRADERGNGVGEGFNLNLPLTAGISINQYMDVLEQGLALLTQLAPAFVVVSVGFDICADDPLGDFSIFPKDFSSIGARLMQLDIPVLLVQEGGYDLDSLGPAAGHLLKAFA